MKVLMILSKEVLTDDRVYREAKALIDAGHEVMVIMWDRWGGGVAEEVTDGLKIKRVSSSPLMRLLPNNLFRNPLWWRAAYKKAIEIYRSGYKFDVVHCHDLDTLPVGVWLKKKLGIKLIYDAHEIFGYMIARDMPKIVVNAAFWLEKTLIRHVDHIITVTEFNKKYFEKLCDRPVTIVMNCKDLVTKEYIPPKNDVLTIIYIGVLHKNRMFPEIVDIIGNIKGVKFVIAGKKENLYEEVKERCKKYDNVEFLGTIPFNEVVPKTLEADAIICMINPSDLNNRIGLANKQFEAMVCGRPIITTRGTYSAKMTEKLKCGIVVDYNGDSLKKGIEKLRDNPKLCEELGRNALKAALEQYNWENEKRKLLKVYESLV